MQPFTDAILLGLGYMSDAIARSFVWVAEVFGVDGEAVVQNMRAAEQARPIFDQDTQQGAPAFLGGIVAVFCTLFFGAIVVLVFHRLAGQLGLSDDDDIQEVKSRAGGRRGGLGALLSRFRRHGAADGDLNARDQREAIRLHYRRFQVLMARAGFPRQTSQTPDEYKEGLAELMPAARPELQTIATAYDAARYSEPTSPVPPPEDVGTAVQALRLKLGQLADGPTRAS
jgi:hypothetical protein